MTLAETCDELEAALAIVTRAPDHEQTRHDLLRALLALGDRLAADVRHYAKQRGLSREAVRDARRREARFYDLKARALSLSKEPPGA